jgi:tetratricopeptide (TPR) repeat protein
MNCEQVTKEEITEKYVLGRLTEAEQGAFELHFFECERCFEEVESLRMLQTELRRAASSVRAETSKPRHLFWRWAWASAAPLAVLAVGVGWQVWRARVAPFQPPAAVQIPTAKPAPQPTVPSMAELSQVRPPEYGPLDLRGAEDDATQRFRAAMRHYVRGVYADAIPGLQAASKLNPLASDISFFLGICYLLTDQTDAAIKQLRRTAAFGYSPYFVETHFYLAKCSLRKGDLRAARSELLKTLELQGARRNPINRFEAAHEEARKLFEQVERLLREETQRARHGKESHEPR